MALLFGFVASGTVTNLFPTVVATLGYSDVDSLLLTVPPYILAVVTSFCNAWHADRTGERYFHITLPLYFAVIAFIIAASTTTIGPRYFAMMLMPAGVYAGYVVALGWISNTLPRPPAKVVHMSCPWKKILILKSACRCSRSHQCCLKQFLDIRFLHVSRVSRTALQYVSHYCREDWVLTSTSCCYERQLRYGLHGHLHGHSAPFHSRRAQ